MRDLTVERLARANSTRVFPACLLSLLLALPPIARAANNFPDDVTDYEKKRNNCDSLRGDIPEHDPDDPDNIHRLASEANKYCKGTDQQLKQLKEKYAENESVLKRLSGYEENIEADMSQ
ncbi:hypothetical protein [Pseudomonas fluorescens]|uniref:hypothetical protein n=1 Tax=Pseudomonas fluorescens TaxID=294 RepID=UPI001F07D2F7|nr:hypothetical protein [Pseudomonas fluorescens]